MKPALGHSPLASPAPQTRALCLLVPAPGRRMRSLLRTLLTTTTGYTERTLAAQHGSHASKLLAELQLAGHVERDLGDRVRLTVSGRVFAREVTVSEQKGRSC